MSTTSQIKGELSKLPFLDNMANINKLDKQLLVHWPEFSWLRDQGKPDSRCFTRFATNISRIGYDNEGRIYSIICPQQGIYSPHYGTLNIEITVTGNRGKVIEAEKEVYAELTVEPKLWFSPGVLDFVPFEIMAALFEKNSVAFPYKKSDAVRVKTFLPGNPDQWALEGCPGLDPRFDPPPFTRHDKQAWGVANLALGVGPQFKTGCALFDDFSEMLMGLFNIQSLNLLKPDNVVSWNVWFLDPQAVDHCEWYRHADLWRRSLQTGHGPKGTPTRDADRKLIPLPDDAFEQEVLLIVDFLVKYLSHITGLDDAKLRKLQDYFVSVAYLIGRDVDSERHRLLHDADHWLGSLEDDVENVAGKLQSLFHG